MEYRGAYVGTNSAGRSTDGLALLPQKLIKRILHLEFVEMADLLPEALLQAMEAQLHRQKGPATDIAVWVQCYATLVSTLSVQYPNEFMAYLVRCHRDYEGPAWVMYDRAFRRRVEATKDLHWSLTTLRYSVCVLGDGLTAIPCVNSARANNIRRTPAREGWWLWGMRNPICIQAQSRERCFPRLLLPVL